MSLIADKKTSEKLENRLNEFKNFGMTLYFLYEENRIKLSELSDIFFSPDDEKSCFAYSNMIRKIKTGDLDKSYEKYKDNYPDYNGEKYRDILNNIYTKKIIKEILDTSCDNIDKIYINTYEYLLGSRYSK